MSSPGEETVLEDAPVEMYSSPTSCYKYLVAAVVVLILCIIILTYYVMVKISGFRDSPIDPRIQNVPEFVLPYDGQFIIKPEDLVAEDGDYSTVQDFEYANGATFEDLNTKIKEGPSEDLLWAQHHSYHDNSGDPYNSLLV